MKQSSGAWTALFEKIKKKQISANLPPAALLYGQDAGLVLKSAELLRAEVQTGETTTPFNTDIFQAATLDEALFFTACQSFPISAEQRFVWIQQSESLTAEGCESVASYLSQINPSTILLLTAGNLKPKDALRKIFEKDTTAWCVPFYPLQERDLPSWIRQQLTQDGFSIEPDALRALCERLKNNTLAARQELDKLKCYMGESRSVTLQDLIHLVGETTEYKVFDLAIALFEPDARRLFHLFDRLMEAGEEPLLLLSAVASRVRLLASARDRLAEGMAPGKVAETLKIFWKEKACFLAQCQRVTPSVLADILLLCHETDSHLKGGSDQSPRHLLERLILNIHMNIFAQQQV